MKKELDPKYDHLKVEQEHYKTWIDKGYFTAGDKSKDPFCIVIPPPNVTGKITLWDMHGIQHYRISLPATNVCRDMICYGFQEWTMQVLPHRQK